MATKTAVLQLLKPQPGDALIPVIQKNADILETTLALGQVGQAGKDWQFPTTRTIRPPSQPVLAFQNNQSGAPDNGTRIYILPRSGASVTSGVGGLLKVFADDYASDQTNYRDMGWYFHANQVGPGYAGGDGGTRAGGVFWFNGKVAGTQAGKNPDIGWCMQDGQYVAGRVALATVGGSTPNIQWVFGTDRPRNGTKVAVVAEFQGDIATNRDSDTSIRWGQTDGATVENALTFQRKTVGGALKLTFGSVQRALFAGDGSFYLGNGTGQQATTATTGFFNIWSMNGTPTGVPTALQTGSVPMVYDSAAKKLWVYDGAWLASAAFA